jgi:dTDP-4-amino-4,6-dideoxygalactose transaminase
MIPFNRPLITGEELAQVAQAIASSHLSAHGSFTERCQGWLRARLGASSVLLTHSCTGALELAAMLAGIGPGDEVIMPSFTFVSTANAVVLRGATPVFVDIRPDTMNLDEARLEEAITPRTRAVSIVHYGGVGANMEAIGKIAAKHGLIVMEDAAQGLFATYQGKPLGTLGALGAISFHETKNVTCGEGGALIVNQPQWIERAEILWEKGTDRGRFRRGKTDRYTWCDLGSSFAPSEITAAFLWAQFGKADEATRSRMVHWERYHQGFESLEEQGRVRRPQIPVECRHNAHLYYLLLPSAAQRTEMIERLLGRGVHAIFHYVPLHDSPAGRRFGRPHGNMAVTTDVAARLVRLPLHARMGVDEREHVIASVQAVCDEISSGQPRVDR